MTADLEQRAVRHRPLPGTGRLGVAAGYFLFSGICSLTVAVVLGVGVVAPSVFASTGPRPWPMFIGSSLLTLGFFRTSRLLERRRRSGAQLAALCFITSVPGFTGRGPAIFELGIAAVGLALVASVWRHLEPD